MARRTSRADLRSVSLRESEAAAPGGGHPATEAADATYARVAGLPLRIDRCELHPLVRDTSSGFTKVSIVVRLTGDGHQGEGEDITWDQIDQIEYLRRAGELSWLRGERTLKGLYRNATVAMEPDPDLYRRVFAALPDAWIEDPAVADRTVELLERHRDRITWDVPVNSVADIEALPWPPRLLNLKPARFGSLHRLFETYDHCAARGIRAYAGGMFEQGPGRGQLQYLASLFHPDGPNDLAPVEYNLQRNAGELPRSPLRPEPHATGFRWGSYDGRRSIREQPQPPQAP